MQGLDTITRSSAAECISPRSTENTTRVVDGDIVADRPRTQVWTSEGRTAAIGRSPNAGRTCSRSAEETR